MYLDGAGVLRYGLPDSLTYASHDRMSVARKGERLIRGDMSAVQPVNGFLDAMREDWADSSPAERIDYIHRELAVLADPLSLLDENDHITCADYTLGELYHARLVLTRLLPFMIAAATEQGRGEHCPEDKQT